ncbi:MAG: galactokinase, partial [Planctomycetota bacterium]|nr:galactokinase [Planctomycetota bacterium]
MTRPASGRPRAEAIAAEKFHEIYGQAPELTTWAPGRVNLIGDHTDTSEGFVLPVALGIGVGIALRPLAARRARLRSLDSRGVWEGRWGRPVGTPGWERYPQAVASSLLQEGVDPPGCEALIASDLPMGEGLGSSAALQVAFARGLLGLLGKEMDPVRIAQVCQRAESEYVGLKCGIMDPFCSSIGRHPMAIFIDTRSLEHRLLGLPSACRVAVVASGVSRDLASSPYNQRRREVESASRHLGLPTLRDLPAAGAEALIDTLPSPERQRARHVFSENARVLDAVQALETEDPVRLGRLMNESHVSLRDDFQASCLELDLLTSILRGLRDAMGRASP